MKDIECTREVRSSEGMGLQGRFCRTLSFGKMGSPLSLRCNSQDKELRVRRLFGEIF